MKKINTSRWGEYAIEDLFEKLTLKCKKENFIKVQDVSEIKTEEFSLPLVNAKNDSNGIMFYGRADEWESASMCIDIVQNGASATGNVFIQPQETGVLWDAYLIKPRFPINSERVLLFLQSVLYRSIKFKYSYDDKATWEKVKHEKIKLPITKEQDPDWEFMESYIRNLEEEVNGKIPFLQKINEQKLTLVDSSTWGTFRIKELFDVSRPSARSIQKYESGILPFVASGNNDNGVIGYCKAKSNEKPDKGNCITVSPVDGSTFYQDRDFLGRGGAGSSILILRNENLNKNIGLFISAVIRRVCSKYAFKDMGSSVSIKEEYIKLPVNAVGEPDWKYMDSYIKKLRKKTERRLSNINSMLENGE